MTVDQLLAGARHVLLDFDGPVCAVFGGTDPAPVVAMRLAAALRARGIQLTPEEAAATDPFQHLYAAALHGPEQAAVAEATLRSLEVEAVATAPLTPGAIDALSALAASGHTVTIVSNNSAAAVAAFADRHTLRPYLSGIVARTDPDPALLKPNPYLLRRAMADLAAEPADCVLIGDSTTDITAAHAAGVRVIAYANKPGKRETFAPLHPDAVITDMRTIAHAVTTVRPRR